MAATAIKQMAREGTLRVLFADLSRWVDRRMSYHRTLKELRSLSDRQLADLGLDRSMLERIAWQAYQDA